jgi:hypothetical protein
VDNALTEEVKEETELDANIDSELTEVDKETMSDV